MTPTEHAGAAAQKLLESHGACASVELLVAIDGLSREACRAWRTGQLATLDGALALGADETRTLLREIDAWAQKAGLAPEPLPLLGGDGVSDGPLTASADHELDALLRTVYRAGTRRVQKDLFLDTAEPQAAKRLRTALAGGDAIAARQRLEDLRAMNPRHALLPAAATLVDALDEAPPATRDAALRQVERLERHWLPAARDCVPGGVMVLVVPIWRRIGAALDEENAPFGAGHPEAHASYAYAMGLDWANARRTVLEEPGYRREPTLLARLAEAECRLGNRREALGRWFDLCWLAPGHFAAAARASRVPDTALQRSWQRLQDQDWPDPPSAAWLPAWMLLDEPGLALANEPTGGAGDPERAFDLLLALKSGSDGNHIARRRDLRDLHAGLFERYRASLKV